MNGGWPYGGKKSCAKSCGVSCAPCKDQYRVESISPRNLSYGYSLYWDNSTQNLYFVDFDLVDECIFRYDFHNKKLYAASIEGGYKNPSFIFPLGNNLFAISIERTIMFIEWDGIASMAKFRGNRTFVEQGEVYAENHFDRGTIDPSGRLVAGTYRTNNCPANTFPNASLYLFEKNRNIYTELSNIKSTTGLAFNTKKKECYFVDYCDNFVSAFDWSPETGYISKKICALISKIKQKHNFFKFFFSVFSRQSTCHI